MKVGDLVEIKNKAGIFKVRLDEELDVQDVNRGFCEAMSFDSNKGKMRLEFHKGNCGHYLVTLTQRFEEHKIIVLEYEDTDECLSAYLGYIIESESENNLFETVY